MIRAITYFAPLLAVACAPVALTRDRAERLCREESGLADGVQGSLGVGVGSRGPAGKVGITITDRVFNPQGEAEFMADCVARRMSGQPRPTTAGITVGASL